MKITHIFILVFALMVASPAFGQKFLQKPYKEWTREEAMKILTTPPWSDQYQSERGQDAAAMLQQQREQADTRLSGAERGNLGASPAFPPIRIQMFSALPVRQALVRLQQLDAGYDKMSAEEKAKFDAGRAGFLECKICKDYYVVMLSKWKAKEASVTNGIFQTLKLEDVKGKIWLENDKGQRREITEFTPAKSETDSSIFFFKRNDDTGAPLFTPSDKLIKFMFSNELRDNKNEYSGLIPRLFEFKAAKMVVDGKLEL